MVKNNGKNLVKQTDWSLNFFKVLIILYVVSLITPLAHGYASFPLAYAKCGLKEPYIASSFLNSNTYSTPADGYYFGPDVFTVWENYFCSSEEAEKAGFRDYSWGRERCKYYDDTGHTICIDGKNGFTAMLPYILLLLFITTLITTARIKGSK